MKIDASLVRKLLREKLKRNPPPDVAEAYERLMDDILEIEEITSIISCKKAKKDAITKELKAQLAEVDRIYPNPQEKCSHQLATYFGDPSGGSDSFTECDLCGSQIAESRVTFTP